MMEAIFGPFLGHFSWISEENIKEMGLILSLCMHRLGPSGECDSRLRPKFERTRQKPKRSNMKKIVWRWSTFSQTARSYSQYIFLRFLVLFAVRFPSRSYSEISVLKTLLHFRILFRAAAHLKRRVRRDI